MALFLHALHLSLDSSQEAGVKAKEALGDEMED
jgi:hypothetical protein